MGTTDLFDWIRLVAPQRLTDQIRFIPRQVPLKHRPRQVPQQVLGLDDRSRVGCGKAKGELLEGELELKNGGRPAPRGEVGHDLAPIIGRRRMRWFDWSKLNQITGEARRIAKGGPGSGS